MAYEDLVRCGIVGLHLFLIPAVPLIASDVKAQPRDQLSGPRVMRAERLAPSETVVMDGAADEVVWQRASPANDLIQREPATGDPATERTEVRALYDVNRVIRGVILRRDPRAILNNQMQRDQSFDTDDSFAWIVDGFLDGRTGYFFEINPAGTMADGLIAPAGSGGLGGSG